MFVRTHLDAASHSPGCISSSGIPMTFISTSPPKETLFVSLTTLLEYDCRVSNTPEWRKKLDSTRGAVLATEYKNNGFRLSLKATEAILAGADQIRLGFLSRRNPKDRRRHNILAVQTFKPKDLAKQLNFDIYAGWGIVKTLTDFLFGQPDGDYVLIKSPTKPVMDLFRI
jgi:translation initiation factor 3 subunit D